MKKTIRISGIIMPVLAIILFFAGDVLAAENSATWRPTYDLIMKWVNFGILVFIIVKFGKGPIMNFLHGRKKEVADEIDRFETAREKALAEMKETQTKLDEREKYLADMKSNVRAQAENNKKRLIEDARRQGVQMLEDAKKKVEYQIIAARQSFQSEMIDMAMNIASEKLPKEISEYDNEIMVEQYLGSVTSFAK
jgi:F-type H+-transporting ATPase subunit b